jgi:hypothetical protein
MKFKLWHNLFELVFIWMIAVLIAVLIHAFSAIAILQPMPLAFLTGFLAYLIIHLIFFRPILSHVMAHEMTHALAAFLLGGKVTAIHATASGGSTIVNKSNWLISLAPYVFPLYSAAALGLYWIAASRFKIYLTGLIGFTYAFHLTLTIYSLLHDQPDLKEAGWFFSCIFILAGNLIVLTFWVAFLWPQVLTFKNCIHEMFMYSEQGIQWINHQIHPSARSQAVLSKGKQS